MLEAKFVNLVELTGSKKKHLHRKRFAEDEVGSVGVEGLKKCSIGGLNNSKGQTDIEMSLVKIYG